MLHVAQHRHLFLFLTAFVTAGAFLWTATYVIAGDAGAAQVIALTGAPRPPLLVALALAAIAGYVGWRIVQRQRFVRSLNTTRIDADELHRTLEAGARVVVVDLRHAIDVEADPHTIPGALQIPAEGLRRHSREIPRDRDIVLYCT